jgi:hypothetical protein
MAEVKKRRKEKKREIIKQGFIERIERQGEAIPSTSLLAFTIGISA